MSEIAVRVQGLSKLYRIGEREPYKLLRDVISRSVSDRFRIVLSRLSRQAPDPGRAPNRGYIWALQDVSFEVHQGDALGIIGHNGAGKSTLLKILSRITLPTHGRAEMHGRMASLLEVGTGFHPELTGKENIYLNGAILGMKRDEVDHKLDEIVGFAEVEKFINTPVKHYSSGMYLRLAFAVAAHLEPEILLIDEVLAVGDAAFQKKCLGKMGEVTSAGRTVLFVSHNMAAVQQLTENSIWIDHGKIAAHGPSAEVIDRYLSSVRNQKENMYYVEDSPRRFSELKREVEFLFLELEDRPSLLVPADEDINILIKVRGNEAINRFRFSLTIWRLDGTPVGNLFGPEIHSIEKGEVVTYRMKLEGLHLARGQYYCSIAAGKGNHLSERVEFDILLDVLSFEMLGPLRPDGVMSEWMPTWGSIRFEEPIVTRVS